MLAEKKPLGVEEIEAQTALELPDREMMALVNVTITNVLNNNTVNVDIAANACANILNNNPNLTCTIN